MKNKIISYTFLLTLLVGLNLSAQQKVIVSMNVFQPLPEVSFAAFLTNPFLENTPRIFQITMTPQGEEVIVKGAILWRKIDESSFNELFNFTTNPFTSRNFSNDDFTSIGGIEIEEINANDDLLQENLNKGKPTGTYKIVIEVYDKNMVFQSDVSEDLDFVNPSQTISIIEPRTGEVLDVGGIIVTWTEVTGVTEYFVKANIRSSKFESLEEALQKGNPIVDNKSVGRKTNVNLRDILDRELVGGEEIVLQVRGVINIPGSQNVIYSNIVNFSLRGASSQVVDKGVKDFETLLNGVIDDMAAQGAEESEAYDMLQKLLDDLQNGNISFNDIKIKQENGRFLTYAEFQQILSYLRRNPDLITNILFESK